MLIQTLLHEALPAAGHLGGVHDGGIGGVNIAVAMVALADVCGVIVSDGREVGQHLSAVNALPVEGIVGHLIKLVPVDLGCHKIRQSAFFHNLRKRCGISEYIRKPENTVFFSKLFLLYLSKFMHFIILIEFYRFFYVNQRIESSFNRNFRNVVVLIVV